MLLILEKPSISPNGDETLAINIFSYDTIIIRKKEETSALGVQKWLDGHFSNQSSIFFIFTEYDSHKNILELFERIIGSLKAGEQVCDLREGTDLSAQLKEMS